MIDTEFTVIGAGPAAICAIPALISQGIDPKNIIWIDKGGFNVGAFGTLLSAGSSLPGNTSVESYQKVNNAIYKLFPECKPNTHFLMDTMPSAATCYLNIAAKPMQHISDYLRSITRSITGTVINISECSNGLEVEVLRENSLTEKICSKKCILANGAVPKVIDFSKFNFAVKTIADPNIVFIKSSLEEYLNTHPNITSIAVIGSSHSAALATMNLLQANINVKQFMNKPYKYAEPCITPNGIKYTKHDNTGLKGEVALFTKKLFTEAIYSKNYDLHVGTNQTEINTLLSQHLDENIPVVAAIGYQTALTLKINNQCLSNFKVNHNTTEFSAIKGLYGIGIAFPLQTTALDGEIEYSVGYGKFWSTVNHPEVISAWLR